jgi:hypothetical protein
VDGGGSVSATLEMRRTRIWKDWPLRIVVGSATVNRPAKLMIPRATDGIGTYATPEEVVHCKVLASAEYKKWEA